MSCKRTLWDHYFEAIQLLSRADVHLEFLSGDVESLAANTQIVVANRLEVVSELRAEIANYIKKKAPSA